MFAKLTRWVSDKAGSPLACALAFALVVAWAAVGPLFDFSESWQLTINTGTTIVTFLMVFLIQSAQNRQEAAIQRKLDGLLAAIHEADNDLIGSERV